MKFDLTDWGQKKHEWSEEDMAVKRSIISVGISVGLLWVQFILHLAVMH